MRTSLHPPPPRHRLAGILLLECLVYIAGFFVITGIAFAAYYRSMEFSRNLQRNTQDILKALSAGEQWRRDVRRATAPLRIEHQNGIPVLVIPQAQKDISYWLVDQKVWRGAGSQDQPRLVLTPVQQSEMLPEEQSGLVYWRWELELKPAQKIVHLPPRFSFQAVPGRIAPPPTTPPTAVTRQPNHSREIAVR